MISAAPRNRVLSSVGASQNDSLSAADTSTGGAYGLRLGGIVVPPNQLVDAPPGWPLIDVQVRLPADPVQQREYVDVDTARLNIRPQGSVLMNRSPARATFYLPAPPSPSALLHPHLAAVGAVWSHWLRREAFHGGGFMAGGGVWGLLGVKGSGKSSTLAALMRVGTPILCDDVLVVDGGAALAGPRLIDLRADAAVRLKLGETLGLVGQRERWRVTLGPIAPELPFRGWTTLRWSEKPAVRRLRGAERLAELLHHRALRVPPQAPGELIELATLPFIEVSRPRRWTMVDQAVELLLGAVSS